MQEARTMEILPEITTPWPAHHTQCLSSLLLEQRRARNIGTAKDTRAATAAMVLKLLLCLLCVVLVATSSSSTWVQGSSLKVEVSSIQEVCSCISSMVASSILAP